MSARNPRYAGHVERCAGVRPGVVVDQLLQVRAAGEQIVAAWFEVGDRGLEAGPKSVGVDACAGSGLLDDEAMKRRVYGERSGS